MIERSILLIYFQKNSKEAHELGKSETINKNNNIKEVIKLN